jgi:uncharacterized membrane protein YGL010W
MARTADDWFTAYGHSHQNGINKAIHWICVPLITLTLLALLWSIPTGPIADVAPWFNWSFVLLAVAIVFYLRLSIMIALGMAAVTGLAIAAIVFWERSGPTPLWSTALVIFVLAWIGQFVGHKIEGEKPSFLEDIQFLLVGPAWLLHFVYRRIGIPY